MTLFVIKIYIYIYNLVRKSATQGSAEQSSVGSKRQVSAVKGRRFHVDLGSQGGLPGGEGSEPSPGG